MLFFLIFLLKLYRILLFSVKPQHESDIGIHIAPPFLTSLPSPSPSHPSRLTQSPCLSFLSHTAIYFPYGNVSFHVTLSIHLTLSSLLPRSISLYSMSSDMFLVWLLLLFIMSVRFIQFVIWISSPFSLQ